MAAAGFWFINAPFMRFCTMAASELKRSVLSPMRSKCARETLYFCVSDGVKSYLSSPDKA